MKTDKLKILIVDDSEIIIKRISEMLSELDNVESVKMAGSYDEAERALERATPDLLLLDINLPDKSGIDLLRSLHAKKSDLRVVMITNQGNAYYRSVCTKLGAVDFVDKSIDFERIPEIVMALN